MAPGMRAQSSEYFPAAGWPHDCTSLAAPTSVRTVSDLVADMPSLPYDFPRVSSPWCNSDRRTENAKEGERMASATTENIGNI